MIRRVMLRAALGVAIAFVGPPTRIARAFTDYDPTSNAWNGTRELVRIAGENTIELRPTSTLDWDQVHPGEGLLVLYPRTNLGLDDVSSFLEDGGRVGWLDDYGDSQAFLNLFGFRREAVVHGVSRAPELPDLLLARPVGAHPLTADIDVLVTNIPTALSHPRLNPVFDFVQSPGTPADTPPQGLVLVAVIGTEGRLVLGGDPSVMLNTMMRFPGNRMFARNVLRFLAAHEVESHGSHRVTLVWGDVHVRGSYHGRIPRRHGRTRFREASGNLNQQLAAISHALSAPALLRPLAMMIAVAVACMMAVVTWGRRPSERYGPRGPEGAPAGVTSRIALFGTRRANMLYPALLARKLLEQRLLRAAGVRAPTDVYRVLDNEGNALTGEQRGEARALLLELEALGAGAEDGPVQRLTAKRFLSLWKRIDAILTPLGGTG